MKETTDMSQGMDYVVYIDNEPHHCTYPFGGVFYADHPSLPKRYCSQHNIGVQAGLWLKQNNAVITSGHRYSMRKHEDKPVTPIPVVTAYVPNDAPVANPDPVWSPNDKAMAATYVLALFVLLLALFVWGKP